MTKLRELKSVFASGCLSLKLDAISSGASFTQVQNFSCTLTVWSDQSFTDMQQMCKFGVDRDVDSSLADAERNPMQPDDVTNPAYRTATDSFPHVDVFRAADCSHAVLLGRCKPAAVD